MASPTRKGFNKAAASGQIAPKPNKPVGTGGAQGGQGGQQPPTPTAQTQAPVTNTGAGTLVNVNPPSANDIAAAVATALEASKKKADDEQAVIAAAKAASAAAANQKKPRKTKKTPSGTGTSKAAKRQTITPPPPVISNVFVSAITQTSATVTWTTDIPATSTVSFGTTIAYNAVPVFDTAPVTNHSVDLTGLTAGTTYHFVAKSAANGLTTVSEDKTFDTLQLPLTWWQNFRKKYLNWKWILALIALLLVLAALWKYGGPLWEKIAKAASSTASQQAAGPTPQSGTNSSALPPIPINRDLEVPPGHSVNQDLNTGRSEVIDRVVEYHEDTPVDVGVNSGTDNRFRNFYMTKCFNNLSNVTVTIGSDDRSINGSSVGNTTMFPVVPPPNAPPCQLLPAQTNAPAPAPAGTPQVQYAPQGPGPTYNWGPPDPTYRPDPLPIYVQTTQQPAYFGGGGGYTYFGGYDPYPCGSYFGGVGVGINFGGRGHSDRGHGRSVVIHERTFIGGQAGHQSPAHFGGGGGQHGGGQAGHGSGGNHGSGRGGSGHR